ncbi:MAG: homocysteine S-methyltransferase family protein [Planctomycetes bacterium]|nr:homocysteine S-methyltransferase family protein [Planctomycetota bacterium]
MPWRAATPSIMTSLVQALKSGPVLVMDGAMGTEIMRRKKLRSPVLCEPFNSDEPDLIRAIHQSYVDVGADVVLTNTFQANVFAVTRSDRRTALRPLWERAVELARSVRPRFVLGDIGPLRNNRPQTIDAMRSACVGVDGMLLETWSSTDGLRRFVVRTALPALVSFTFRRCKPIRTFCDLAPEHCAHVAARVGVVAIGANCGEEIGVDEMVEIIGRFRSMCDLPIFVKMNAGSAPRRGRCYPFTPAMMGEAVEALLEAGVCMIGGCCGTTPDHIRKIREVVDRHNAKRHNVYCGR